MASRFGSKVEKLGLDEVFVDLTEQAGMGFMQDQQVSFESRPTS